MHKTFALVPVNKLSHAKTRLAELLSQKERAELVLAMLQDVLDALQGMSIIIISPDDIRGELRKYQFDFILETEKRGLNAAVEAANSCAIERGADATLFVPADAPLIKKEHVAEILKLGRRHRLIISPSRGGGTGILYRRPPGIINSRFTSTSFLDHKKEAEKQGVEMFVYDSFALYLDIDTPQDIAEFLLHGEGTRTHAFLKKFEGRL